MRPVHVYAGQAFATLYTYTGDDLGVTYTPEESRFKLWAPTASTANVLLYDTGQPIADETARTIPLMKDANGTWSIRVTGDLKGKYYTFQVQVDGRWQEAVDPYARAVGFNGLRGRIIDLAVSNPPNWHMDKGPVLNNPTDAIIYELHLRDLSVYGQSGIQHKGKFLGLTEVGTTSPAGLKTGLDHLRELGITHVHLLPCFDYKFDEDDGTPPYNWGYNPLNYNAPEDSYATNPIDGVTGVREFKRMVQTLHNYGIGVIMDVVYNHTFDIENSNFNLLVPNYYYRVKADGTYSNGSGCGNETASERSMVRKFIIDSVLYWAKEYHIDGFRFDLMGLHDIETMNLLREKLDEVNPHILMYGEGWTGGQSMLPLAERAAKDNAHLLSPRIALFSDDIRDSIKGSSFDGKSPGFVNGAAEIRGGDIRFGVVAAVNHPQVDPGNRFWASHPTQTITYNSCHDNLTLWDKLIKTNPNASTRELEAMNRLAATIVLTSQGIAFLHAGEEMARTKQGNDNSYNAPDAINRLDWGRKQDFLALFNYYKGLIAIRRTYPAFRMTDADQLRQCLTFLDTPSPAIVAYTLKDADDHEPLLLVAFNGGSTTGSIPIPEGYWAQLVNHISADVVPLAVIRDTLKLPPCSAAVLVSAESAITVDTLEEAPAIAPDFVTEPAMENITTVEPEPTMQPDEQSVEEMPVEDESIEKLEEPPVAEPAVETEPEMESVTESAKEESPVEEPTAETELETESAIEESSVEKSPVAEPTMETESVSEPSIEESSMEETSVEPEIIEESAPVELPVEEPATPADMESEPMVAPQTSSDAQTFPPKTAVPLKVISTSTTTLRRLATTGLAIGAIAMGMVLIFRRKK